MKRTKNMIYKETVESHELVLYATNDSRLYNYIVLPIIANLKRKYKKGCYDSNRAIDAWYHLANAASDLYNKDFGYRFNVQERYTAAVDFESFYFENVKED